MADMLVLSHGHYDHTGGIPGFIKNNHKAPIYIHQGAFHKRYFNSQGKPGENIGITCINQETGGMDISSERLVLNKGPLHITDSIMISGEIPSTVPFEDVPQDFYIDDGT